MTANMQSTVQGTQWEIDPQGTVDVYIVGVRDSKNVRATDIVVEYGYDLGINTNTKWVFEHNGPLMETLNATDIVYDGATLHGRICFSNEPIIEMGFDYWLTGYMIDRVRVLADENSTPDNIFKAVTSLKASTQYYFSVYAITNTDVEGRGSGLDFTTAGSAVTLSADPLTMSENGGTSIVTATLSNQSSANVTVHLSYSGTSTKDTDYTSSGVSISILAGSTTGSVTLTGVNDLVYEGNESILVDIDSVDNGVEYQTQQVNVTLLEDEPAPVITLSAIGSEMVESGGVSYIAASISQVCSQAVTVTISYSGTASPEDYSNSGTIITIAAGDSNSSTSGGNITLTATYDDHRELDETIIGHVTLVSLGSAGNPDSVTITIIDDDGFMNSSNFEIPIDVFGSEGGHSTSDSFLLGDTMGEFETSGSESDSFELKSGFWQGASIYTISVTPSINSIVLGGIVGSGKSNEGNLSANSVTLNVKTDNPGGYTLSWKASPATGRTNSTLENEHSDSISAISVGASPVSWPDLASGSGWGARLGSASTTFNSSLWGNSDTYALGKWIGIPALDWTFTTKNSATSLDGDDQIVIFGAEIGADKIQPTGTYLVDVVFTAVTID
ncbi:MAG: Calx-beta domain protein [bacterium ADurb.Bin400]|nr:MAG: Calx-beta domain protein [bacterium ADurb.Bin400]